MDANLKLLTWAMTTSFKKMLNWGIELLVKDEEKWVIILIKSRCLLNKLKITDNLEYLKKIVSDVFWSEFNLVLKHRRIDVGHHDREMNIWRLVHY